MISNHESNNLNRPLRTVYFRYAGTEVFFLLYKNVKTNQYDFPSVDLGQIGFLNENGSKLKFHHIGISSQLECFLFIEVENNADSVITSDTTYVYSKAVTYDEICKLIPLCKELYTIYKRIELNKDNFKGGGGKNIKSTILNIFRNKLQTYQGNNISWFLCGSIAANEHTVFKKKLMSDIDVVIQGTENFNAVSQDIALIQKEILKIREFKYAEIGCFLIKAPAPYSTMPFWTYFYEYSEAITGDSFDLEFNLPTSQGDNTIDNSLFRVIWYVYLRTLFLNDVDRINYLFLKGVITNILLKQWRAKEPFKGYANLMHSVRNKINNFDPDISLEHLYALYALEVKLNHLDYKNDLDWRKIFKLCVENDNIPGNENIHSLMIQIILNMEEANHEKIEAAILKIKMLCQKDLCPKILYDYALKNNDYSIIWLLLIDVRVRFFHKDIRFSLNKYQNYVTILSKRARIALPLDLNCVLIEYIENIYSLISDKVLNYSYDDCMTR